ncbi:hypothetical protein OEIGOIKO_04204 [Streptomyces chrestomyceticus JCM 4735]|uniref:Uncharacterized protein n=1 Tax=Streptomyces chrestomyceticus JCM 4735 TaxID=1306181 RepID=A0A7U9KYQ9_9ACTN|nr:hypothetical protein [Streptomyces chrestomyceticus]GCD36441.1 hypothetical protein OEIGOIKO_04204 [Streptomyces chrestomyceticus JCM 4735]
MSAQPDEQCTRAAEAGSSERIKGFRLKWATAVELKRRRDLDQRMEAAQRLVHTLHRDDPQWRAAMDEVRDVYNEARRAVTGG